MAQFDVFENPNKNARGIFPYVIVLQSDVALGRSTIVVAPVALRSRANADDRVMLPVEINKEACVVVMHGLAAISRHTLKKVIARVPEIRDRLPRAIDYLFLGI